MGVLWARPLAWAAFAEGDTAGAASVASPQWKVSTRRPRSAAIFASSAAACRVCPAPSAVLFMASATSDMPLLISAPLSRLRDVPGDLVRGGGLLLHGAGDGRLHVMNLIDHHADLRDGPGRPACVALDRFDLLADVFGGPRRLLGQLLDLIGHHREALARLARPRRFNGRVERQQLGLLGDRGDYFDDVADLGAALAQLGDRGVGQLGGSYRARRRPAPPLAF